VQCIEITGRLDRPSLEALYLELRRLARRYGGEVRKFRVEKLGGAAAPDDWNARSRSPDLA
jgi:hypothetical protein